MARLTSSQLKRRSRDGPHGVGQFFVAADAAERLEVLLGLLLDDVDDVVDGDDADEPILGVDHRRRDEIVACRTSAPPPPGPPVTRDAAAILVDQLGSGTGRRGAQQHVERDRALPALLGVDDIDLVEPVRQVRRLAHVVDRLADGPVRRHRDELGLHPPAGGIFRIIEAALERDALGQRQLLENLLLVLLVEVFEHLDRIVGFELADALGDGLRRQFLEDFLADGLVDFGQRREVEIARRSARPGGAVVGIERLDQVAEIGLVQVADDMRAARRCRRLDRVRDRLDEFVADVAVFIAHRHVVEYRDSSRATIGRDRCHRPWRASPFDRLERSGLSSEIANHRQYPSRHTRAQCNDASAEMDARISGRCRDRVEGRHSSWHRLVGAPCRTARARTRSAPRAF